jgi:tetratricopeptide (TPR) repeat protein
MSVRQRRRRAVSKLDAVSAAASNADPATSLASWNVLISRNRSDLRESSRNLDHLSRAAPHLVDTVDRDALLDILSQLPVQEIATRSGLAFATGYGQLLEGAIESGVSWLTRAQAALLPDESLLSARIAFELGAVYIARNCAIPAEVVLLGARHSADSPNGDLLHLRALAAEAMGDHAQAGELYRQTLRSDVEVLSPSTRVLAMINLAASCSHRDPAESLALTELAVAMVDSRELHGRMRPAALNIMGYALICLGRWNEARDALEKAMAEAAIWRYDRVALYAAFNLAIVDELQGMRSSAESRLNYVGESASERFPELAGWVRIRSAWLAWLAGDAPEASSILAKAQTSLRSMRYAESLSCLQHLIDASTGALSGAISGFESLCRSAAMRGDSSTEFALLLRLVHLELAVGGERRAVRNAARAITILRRSSLRASPNWWSKEIVDSFVEIAQDPITGVLMPPALEHVSASHWPAVRLFADGTATIGGTQKPLRWGAGRTGSRILKRMFCELMSSHPRSIQRDVLADNFWPESEGDAAIRNLYAATNDLRKVLVDLPGVRLCLGDHGYSLRFDDNVELVESLGT